MKKGVYMMWAVMAVSGLMAVSAQAQDSIGLDNGLSIGGSRLYNGQHVDTTRDFSSNRTYTLYAMGGENARNVDLIVLDSKGREVVSDVRLNRNAELAFNPPTNGRYTIRLRLTKTWDSSAYDFCWFAIMTTSGGWDVPVSVFDTSLSRLITGTLLPASSGFNPLPIRIYGYVMQPRESNVIDLSGFQNGQYALVAVGDDNAWDLDLEVFQNGRRLASDTLVDAIPFCQFRMTTGTASLKVIHDSGKSASFVLMALYDK